MANFQYAADILSDALFRANEPTDGTSDYATQAVVYLNRAYEQVYNGGSEIDPDVNEDWRWLRATPPGVLNLIPAITTGTASVTNNNTAVTLSSAPAIATEDWYFKVDGKPDVYRVGTHTAASTSVTLDAAYTGDTDTEASYTLFKVEYDLATDILRLVAPMRAFRSAAGGDLDYKVYGVDYDALDTAYPLALIESGVPDRFAMVGERRVRFNRYGSTTSGDYIRLEYEYLFRPCVLEGGASEEVFIPLHRRRVLADIVAAYILAAKNDDRAAGALEMGRRGLIGMAQENRHMLQNTSSNRAFRVFARGTRRRGYLLTTSGLRIG